MCKQGGFRQQQQHKHGLSLCKALQPSVELGSRHCHRRLHAKHAQLVYLLCPAPSLAVACGCVPRRGCAQRFAGAMYFSTLHCLSTTHRAPGHPPPPCAVTGVLSHLKTLNLPACPPLSRGHASENPDLPAALAERNIRFLGPGSVAMAALGDKVRPAPLCPWGTWLLQRRSAPCTVVESEQQFAPLLHRQPS